jgi:hypothetical protein
MREMMRAENRGSGRSTKAALLGLGLMICLVAPCWAQVNSRVEEIQQARREKAAKAEPEELSGAEKRLNTVIENHLMERLATGWHGLTLVWGGLPVGQGFAIGPQYYRPDVAGGNLKFRTSARGTTGGAGLLDLQLTAPKIAKEKIFVDFLAMHRNLPRIEYFGQGPDSSKEGRSHFRLEDTSFDFKVGYRPFKYNFSRPLSIGVTGGYLKVNTGPGNRNNIPQTDEIFTPEDTPGLDDQTDFLRGGFFVQYDYRDFPGEPRNGGNYLASFTYYDDRDLMLRDHRRLDVDAQQYFSFWNDRRVIALRLATRLTFATGDQTVPFYLQPHIGGSDTLRGFRAYRFYDNNAIIATGEYRWEAFSGLDMALFLDAGKVATKRSQVNFHELEAAAGVGFRFNVQNSVFLRLDVGFSHEGTRMWLTFHNVF